MASSRFPLAPEVRGARGMLVVVGETAFGSFPLPFKDTVTIGRSSLNDVAIDDASISREHAVLHVGDTVRIEDLGSTNGTWVRDPLRWSPEAVPDDTSARERRVEPSERVEIVSGSIIKVGSVMLMFQARAQRSRPRRLWPRALFEERVEEEGARAARDGSVFAVLRVHVDAPAFAMATHGSVTAQIDDRARRVVVQGPPQTDVRETVEEVLVRVARVGDVIAIDETGAYDVLLSPASPEVADAIAAKLVDELASRELTARVGVACYPRDGRSPEALLARAAKGDAPVPEASSVAHPIIVRDPQMIALHELIDRVAVSDVTVLLLGETGVGKEVIAEAVHRRSPRAQGPLVRINCAALPEALLEGELFGYERGAFTGADKAKVGLIETAHGGTLFLDEVGEMPLALQAKLLRVLEERKLMRLGARVEKAVDVRILAATNRDLEAEVEAGRFRSDLYFRLHVFPLDIPPLRERSSEIEPLASAFVASLCEQLRRPVPALSVDVVRALEAYAWPGNIRELRNVMQRALLLCHGDAITTAHLPLDRMGRTIASRGQGYVAPAPPPSPQAPVRRVRSAEGGETMPPPVRETSNLKATVEQLERDRILAALEECAGNQTRAAKLLGITRKVLLSRLDRYGIARPRK